MKRFIFVSLTLIMLASCGGSGFNGELTGVPNRKEWFEPDPYGMVFIPAGSFNMGPNDQDVPFALTSQAKTVTIDPFWMDITEITNNEYRQFVYWVRDSIAMRLCVQAGIEEFKADIDVEKIDPAEYNHDDVSTCFLNWEKVDKLWNNKNEEVRTAVQQLFLPINERFFRKKEIDSRKLIYDYMWVDLRQAALKQNRYNFNEDMKGGKYEGTIVNSKGEQVPLKSREDLVMKGRIYVYPDTLVWMSDYTYSYNEPHARNYFWHPAFDNYPVVGITWVQANAFCIWRTELINNFEIQHKRAPFESYRLPTEAEWEYAARGGLALSMYPWGGPYTRNYQGCFIANFKPLRGNYIDDGSTRTIEVAKYPPNEYGLYDMAGNVAEWTSNAFDESAYSFTHDLNPDYSYNAMTKDPPVLKRKVIRGGSWKDIGYYLQVATRTYEYQDTAKSYIGFRCVRSFMGREATDWSVEP